MNAVPLAAAHAQADAAAACAVAATNAVDGTTNADARGRRSWLALAALLALGSALAWWLPAATLDWQPALAPSQPWRAWSAAFVHWSPTHLAVNLAGTAVVAAFGVVARVPARLALAWAASWPLTHAGLLVRPELAHYGGLSGVLHAGVAAVALWLVAADRGGRRLIGAAVLGGLIAKVLLEEPWGPALRTRDGWDIALAPIAHCTGTLAGLACAALAIAWSRPGR